MEEQTQQHAQVRIINKPQTQSPLKDVSGLVIVMGCALSITSIVLVQYFIHNIQSLLGVDSATTADMINASGASAVTGAAFINLLVDAAIVVPLFLLALFFFIKWYKKPVKEPLKIASFAFFVSMLGNFFITVFHTFSFLNDINHSITVYIVCLAIIACLVFGIIKIQGAQNGKQ